MIDYCPSRHTPFDDEPDVIEEAQKFLKQHAEGQLQLSDTRDLDWAAEIIKVLLDELEEQ